MEEINFEPPDALKVMQMLPEELKCDPLVHGYTPDGILHGSKIWGNPINSAN